jgi:hypothetical protein
MSDKVKYVRLVWRREPKDPKRGNRRVYYYGTYADRPQMWENYFASDPEFHIEIEWKTESEHFEFQIEKLKEEKRVLQQEVKAQNESLHHKNKILDAMHYVWCDGGCDKGVHRWMDIELTEEMVEIVERNTKRLRCWYHNHKSKMERKSD